MTVVVLVVAVVLLGLVATFGGQAGGRAFRRRIVERTGKDPADNRMNDGLQRFYKRHPVWTAILTALMAAVGIGLAIHRAASY